MGTTLFIVSKPDSFIADLIDELAKHYEIEKIWFLVEEEDVEAAITHLPKLPPLELLVGDLRGVSLGLKEPLRIWEKTTHFLYLNEFREFGAPFSTYYLKNIEAVKNALNFALRMKSLRQMIYMSTVFVAGLNTKVYPEAIVEHENDFRNHYERSKYFAEIEVSKKNHLLPITVIRPSFLVYTRDRSTWTNYAYHVFRYISLSRPVFGPYYIGSGRGSMNFVDFETFKTAFIRLFDDSNAIGSAYNIVSADNMPSDSVLEIFASSVRYKISRRISISTAKTISGIFGSFFGLPHDMVGYFADGDGYALNNMESLKVVPPDAQTIEEGLKKLAKVYSR